MASPKWGVCLPDNMCWTWTTSPRTKSSRCLPLRGKVVMTLFYEARTRTRISFEEAGKVLSAEVINMSGFGSSVEKGESLLNTALTLQAMGADIIVMRHPHSGAPNFVARSLGSHSERGVSIINAGDGLHAHPT